MNLSLNLPHVTAFNPKYSHKFTCSVSSFGRRRPAGCIPRPASSMKSKFLNPVYLFRHGRHWCYRHAVGGAGVLDDSSHSRCLSSHRDIASPVAENVVTLIKACSQDSLNDASERA